MNVRYLEIFEAVAKTGSFTGAAKKLYLTQSAVSHAIAELELQTKTALFDRLPRGVCLTQCGILLLEEASVLLSSCRDLEERISHLEEYASIRIVSSITIASFYLPRILRELQREAPKLRVQVQVVSAAHAMHILQEGNADLALIEGVEPSGCFCAKVFGTYHLVAAYAQTFPLAKQSVSIKELCELPLLLREKGSAIRDTFDSMLYLNHQKAYPVWESVNSTALIKAAEAGLGVTILPELLLDDLFHDKKLLPLQIEDVQMENKMMAVYHKDKYMTHHLQEVMDAVLYVH